MTQPKSLPPHASFESLRKQAKKLAHQFAAGDPEALIRVRAQLPDPALPLSLRDAQLVLAREYGFAGWQDLRTAVLRQEGKGLEWAAAAAERVIHDNQLERLAQLIQQYPALLSWHGDSGESLLSFATQSFGDSGNAFREKAFTRIECAELLLNAGATVEPAIWEGAIRARAKGVLRLLSSRGILPRNLQTLTALGDIDGVRAFLPAADAAAVTQAFNTAWGFQHREMAALLLDRCIELNPLLGQRLDQWRGRSGFLDYLADHQPGSGDPWRAVVMNELRLAMIRGDLKEFNEWLEREPDLSNESNLDQVIDLMEIASYRDRGPFIARLLEFAPAIRAKRPSSGAIVYALEYGNAHLLPLLTPIWPMPEDLPHSAGAGDFERVKKWFEEAGRPKLGSLAQHHPANHPPTLRNMHWDPPTVQHVLDVALAWAVMNRHFEIASFLLERGANVNTSWSTHEPASILHEVAIRGNYEAAQFLIDQGIDLTILDYRWNATAEGWAIHASAVGEPPVGDVKMAELLARARHSRNG